jgi:hypothetical protein
MNFDNNEKKSEKPVSAYQQLSGILNALKSEEITLNDAINHIQLKESQTSTRPYCKVTNNGALALHNITERPIVLYADQWEKLLKVTKSNYIDNYIKYNSSRLKYKTKKQYNKNNVVNDKSSNENFV